jgi:hypothetical protein
MEILTSKKIDTDAMMDKNASGNFRANLILMFYYMFVLRLHWDVS